MIKINLMPQKRARLRRVATAEPGGKDLLIGIGALAGLAVIVFFALDLPRRGKLHDLLETNAQLAGQIKEKEPKIKDYEQLQKAADQADQRASEINRLMSVRTVPGNVLQELGDILTQGHRPTMTAVMSKLAGTNGDPNKQFDDTWDPSHVWLMSYDDKNGDFTIEGGAQAEVDVTQFAKRLAASVYFWDVAPSRQERIADKDSGITYYKFTITGKVAY
jgi:Tfp pilus assembly protein PilN